MIAGEVTIHCPQCGKPLTALVKYDTITPHGAFLDVEFEVSRISHRCEMGES